MPNNRFDFAGRDDRLGNEIVQTLENIQRTARGNYDELVVLLNAARYSAVPAKIRKMNYSQLLSMRSLILGYQSRVQADNKGPIEVSFRPELVGAGVVLTVPQTMTLKRADGVPQLVLTGLNGGNQIAHTFLPGNPSGVPDDTATLLVTPAGAEILGAFDVRAHFVKQNDTTLLFWDANLNNDPLVRSTTLDAAGEFTAPVTVATLTPTGLDYTDRVIGEGFCDGRNLWVPEYDHGTTNLVIHKVNLVDGTITTQEIDNVEAGSATSNLFLWANGDFCLLIAEEVVGGTTAYLAFNLPDGAVSAALNLDPTGGTGVTLETGVPTRLLGGFGGTVHTANGPRYRGFFTPNAAGANAEAIHVIDFDPTLVGSLPAGAALIAAMITVADTPVQIAGQTFSWPISLNGVYGVSADGARLVLAGTRVVTFTDSMGDTQVVTSGKMYVFSMNEARQIHALQPFSEEVANLSAVSSINVAGANMGLVASLVGDAVAAGGPVPIGQHALELNA